MEHIYTVEKKTAGQTRFNSTSPLKKKKFRSLAAWGLAQLQLQWMAKAAVELIPYVPS